MSVFHGLSSGNISQPSRLGLAWLPVVPVGVPSEPALPPVADVVVSFELALVWLLEPPEPPALALVPLVLVLAELPLPLLVLLPLSLLFSSLSAASVSSDPQPIPTKPDSRHTKAKRMAATMRLSRARSKVLDVCCQVRVQRSVRACVRSGERLPAVGS